jgi:hypothetical protein
MYFEIWGIGLLMQSCLFNSHAKCLSPPDGSARDAAVHNLQKGVSIMNTHSNSILVGVDFSPGSKRAFTTAVELAARLSVDLYVAAAERKLGTTSSHD